MKKYSGYLAVGLLMVFTFMWWKHLYEQRDLAVIKYFPLNQEAVFNQTASSLTLQKQGQENEQFNVLLSTESILNQKSYLRQDFSLLFQNGRLKEFANDWKQNTDRISQKTTIKAHESSLFQSITIHYAEIHTDNDTPSSSFKLTDSNLFVIASRYGPIKSFQTPETDEQKEWAFTLSSVSNSRLAKVLDRYTNNQKFDITKYQVVPLTKLLTEEKNLLAGYSDQKRLEITEKLWEAFYSLYVSGIKKQDGTVINPIDSTIPLILRKQGSNKLIILIQDRSGNIHELYQLLP